MDKDEGLFREKAVKHATSPEQLDQVLRIVPFRAWVVLLCFSVLFVAIVVWSVLGRIPETILAPCILYPEVGGPVPVFSFATGYVKRIFVTPGNVVKPGQPLMELFLSSDLSKADTAKTLMINNPSSRLATILNLYVVRGDWVSPGSSLLLLQPQGEQHTPLSAYAFVSPEEGKKVKAGMPALIALDQVNPDQTGYLKGRVKWVSLYPISELSLGNLLRNPTLAQSIVAKAGAPYEVILSLEPDAASVSGYQWTGQKGRRLAIQAGSTGRARLIISEQAPITMIFPWASR